MSAAFAAILLTAVALGYPPGDLPPVIRGFGPKLENYYRKPDPKIAGLVYVAAFAPRRTRITPTFFF